MQSTITIPAKYNGPTGFGNGGYVCGVMANHFPWVAEFRLRKMIPCDQALQLEVQDEAATLYADMNTFVTAQKGKLASIDLPANPGFAAAEAARKRYLGFRYEFEYDQCYVCSPKRPDDGMCIHAGPTEVPGIYAASWIPEQYMLNEQGKVANEFIYAALDCPGAYAAMGDQVSAMLLGSFTVEITGSLQAGDRCVIVAWESGQGGRRRFAHTLLYGPNDQVIGRADATWFLV